MSRAKNNSQIYLVYRKVLPEDGATQKDLGLPVEISMNAFKVVATLLFLVLAGRIAYTLPVLPPAPSAPQVLDLGSAFEGNLQLPAEKIQAAFSAARGHILKVNSVGTELHTAGNIAAMGRRRRTAPPPTPTDYLHAPCS